MEIFRGPTVPATAVEKLSLVAMVSEELGQVDLLVFVSEDFRVLTHWLKLRWQLKTLLWYFGHVHRQDRKIVLDLLNLALHLIHLGFNFLHVSLSYRSLLLDHVFKFSLGQIAGSLLLLL